MMIVQRPMLQVELLYGAPTRSEQLCDNHVHVREGRGGINPPTSLSAIMLGCLFLEDLRLLMRFIQKLYFEK